ncbi:hypothetical protein ILUMI_21709 [Ignelater luminosus]|uniref:Glucosidase II subunit alpha n=1 Tax=Ignelater luminosus TaxID=2038154 RepID=A0A8K0G3A9_IGNLU|nr:hypothetical protein ILUMI_21709 [Ignelater luminosus]
MLCVAKIIKSTLLLVLLFQTISVHSWKSCHETFCGRVRRSPEGFPRYSLDLTSISESGGGIAGDLVSEDNSKVLKLEVELFTETTFLVNVVEKNAKEKRYRASEILLKQAQITSWKIENRNDESITIKNGNTSAIIFGNPFKIEFYSHGKLISILNSKNRLVYETDHQNSAIALDISFVQAQRAYGIPQHADNMALRSTIDNVDPYRLYNLDYGRYRIKSTESLYGSVPVLYGYGVKQSSGIFWQNSAQTWIDIVNGPNQVDAFFMSESGALDVTIFTGPTLAESLRQYVVLTSVAPLPQYFALGYHQSRYSYMTQHEVLDVVDQFDKNDLPMDSVWLDIDYTDNKKYFTWDPIRFPDPISMQNKLASTNRNLIAIIDPHIKVDSTYFVHNISSTNGFYVRNPDGTDYVGKCWPGDSSWLDFSNVLAAKFYASLFSLDTFKAKNVHIWNDMNEPAIFENGEYENTMSGDLLHFRNRDVKHRDVHNRYGYEQTAFTFLGLMERFGSPHKAVRPFILTRSHYAGSQLYSAIWTGDTYASWEYLQISFPMCLTEALVGISFCGADVGGFAGIPDDELYLRWYQAGAWLPFYRGHSAIDVPRREPYLYPEKMKSRIRTALNQRYAHLPVWYTQFWEHTRSGDPVIRPIIYNFPSEEDAMSIDQEVCVGDNILAAPILKPDVFAVSVYLPGGESEVWYNIDDNYKELRGTGRHILYVDLDSIPVFYRGGSIIPRKDIPRQSAAATKNDPYTLYVCLDENNEAKGTLYVDDYESFSYRLYKTYLYLGFKFSDNNFSSYKIDKNADYDGAADIGQIIILRPPKGIRRIKLTGNNKKEVSDMSLTYSADNRILIIDNLLLDLRTPFHMQLL